MLAYKIIGIMMILTALSCSFARLWSEYLNERQRRRRRRLAQKRRSAYKKRFRAGALRDIEQWRGEDKPKKHLNVVCKNPEYAEVWK